jgi:hypothetical protein
MKTTYEKLFIFANTAQRWLASGKGRTETKLGYALKRMDSQVKALHEKHQAALQDINIDCCAVDAAGVILNDEYGRLRFTKDGLRERNKKQEELSQSEIEIEPCFATQTPDDLSDAEREAFAGFVLKVDEAAAAVS